jgi:hypothetical protein
MFCIHFILQKIKTTAKCEKIINQINAFIIEMSTEELIA